MDLFPIADDALSLDLGLILEWIVTLPGDVMIEGSVGSAYSGFGLAASTFFDLLVSYIFLSCS